jgi:Protein ChrB, N-terminal
VSGSFEWVLLTFRIPREPSSPRIAVWRRLRAMGVAQVVDGVVALPADARTREQFEWVADQVVEAGGEATLWIGRLTSSRQETELASRMARAVASAYLAVIEEVTAAEGVASRRAVGRLRRELRRISTRDFFPPPERDLAHAAVESLSVAIEVVS